MSDYALTAREAPAHPNPAAAYLASLSTTASRRGQTTALRMIAQAIGAPDWQSINWHTLSAANARAIMAHIEGAPATRNKVLSALKGIARMSAEIGVISHETRAAIEGIRGDRGSRQPAGRDVDAGEIGALRGVCESDPTPAGARDGALIALMRATGMRRAEVCALRLADVDIERGALRVVGKGNKERAVYIANGSQRALRDWLDVRGDAGTFVFIQIGKSGRMHTSEGLTPQAINIALDKRIESAGIAGLTPHDLRRTLAGDLLDNGADIATVARLLGHSSVTTTQRYDRRDNRAVQRAAASVSVPYKGRRI